MSIQTAYTEQATAVFKKPLVHGIWTFSLTCESFTEVHPQLVSGRRAVDPLLHSWYCPSVSFPSPSVSVGLSISWISPEPLFHWFFSIVFLLLILLISAFVFDLGLFPPFSFWAPDGGVSMTENSLMDVGKSVNFISSLGWTVLQVFNGTCAFSFILLINGSLLFSFSLGYLL